MDNLAGILAGPGRPSDPGATRSSTRPDTDDMAALTTELDAILGRGRDRPPGRTRRAAARGPGRRLRDLENRVSAERRGLHERIDTLQAELVERHKSGRASVDGLLS